MSRRDPRTRTGGSFLGAALSAFLLLAVPVVTSASSAAPAHQPVTHRGVCSWLTMKEIARVVTALYNASLTHLNTSKLPPAGPLGSTVFHAWKKVCGSPLTRSEFQRHGIHDFSLLFTLNPRKGTATAGFAEAWDDQEVVWFVNGWTGAISGPLRL